MRILVSRKHLIFIVWFNVRVIIIVSHFNSTVLIFTTSLKRTDKYESHSLKNITQCNWYCTLKRKRGCSNFYYYFFIFPPSICNHVVKTIDNKAIKDLTGYKLQPQRTHMTPMRADLGSFIVCYEKN